MARARNLSVASLGIPSALDPGRPKGDQLRELLEHLAERLGPGAALPSDRALAEHFAVARMTVRQEVLRLVADGVLDIRPGSGTYVEAQRPRAHSVGVSWSRLGTETDPGARVLEHEVLEVSGRLSRLLGVPRGTQALRLVRLRSSDGVPVGIERSTLPLSRFPGLEDVDMNRVSLYDTIRQRYGVMPHHVRARASAELPTDGEARALGIDRAQPCVVVATMLLDAEGAVVETGRSIYRGDRYDLDLNYDLPTNDAQLATNASDVAASRNEASAS